MTRPPRNRLPLRRHAALTEPAYERLRPLNESRGLGNNYRLTVLLETLDETADPPALDRVRREFTTECAAPAAPAPPTGTTR